MAENKKERTFVLENKLCNVYADYRDNSFDIFFKSCIKATLQKNKSIYELIQFCYNAGYWNAMKDMVEKKDFQDTAKKILKEIREQENGED